MNRKGTILIETFLALLMLSIGILGALGIFSNSLAAGRKSHDQSRAVQEMNRVLFESLANPAGVIMPDNGRGPPGITPPSSEDLEQRKKIKVASRPYIGR